MSLPVFLADLDAYLAGDTPVLPEIGAQFVLDGAEGKHAATVKRLQVGEVLILIDGCGAGVEARVEGVDKAALALQVLARHEFPRPAVTVVQALPKAERSELAVDLMTQGGVGTIVPWQASRSIAKWANKAEKGRAKWRSAAVAAAKQSRRLSVPEIGQLAQSSADVVELIQQCRMAGGTAVMLHEEASVPFASVALAEPLLIIVGPEGGLAPEEVEEFRAAGAAATVLGPEVLRTASAGLVALAAYGALRRW
ncbi:16S rRNA (uracil(1498)-N(3))-methyltransferase [Corynebacterium epidermidicanis]|uniref:Ribosomal RNA small subunit methyltransferase E n=1 Tax=Corynebacterium epidermidicanis TaxID=1050174 RepID=A0A0G3GSX2_9CORY|nr:16S rRNA (uracil(1498)-N(3))-methyltransferase [Corynebacterium epidermidicanis]AKK03635.1 RNA methyltransferase, RsmE family [Corynebacterium epidermidicanis]